MVGRSRIYIGKIPSSSQLAKEVINFRQSVSVLDGYPIKLFIIGA